MIEEFHRRVQDRPDAAEADRTFSGRCRTSGCSARTGMQAWRPSMKPLTIAFLGFDDVAALDLIGTLEAFAAAEVDGQRCYETRIVGVTSQVFAAESGVLFRPHLTLADGIDADTVIIPGGSGLRTERINRRVAA